MTDDETFRRGDIVELLNGAKHGFNIFGVNLRNFGLNFLRILIRVEKGVGESVT